MRKKEVDGISLNPDINAKRKSSIFLDFHVGGRSK